MAGYTEHMDERGEVKEPPPFDKVAMDWGEIGAEALAFIVIISVVEVAMDCWGEIGERH